VKVLVVVLLTSRSWPEALYNLRSGSWWRSANGTAARYAAIQCIPV